MKTLEELKAIRQRNQQQVELRKEHNGYRILVGMATCGIAAGARPVMTSLIEEVQKRNLNDVVVTQTGCIGMCRLEPIVEVIQPDGERITYIKMNAEKVKRIVAEHIVNGSIVNEYTISNANE